MRTDRPVILLRPAPQARDRIFDATTLARLHDRFDVQDLEEAPDERRFDELLPRAFAIVGQPDLPAERLRRARALRALINVEGNFFANVDYPTAFAQGIRVLGCGPAYADAVAEMSLGLALDLARGISREDRAFRAGREQYVAANTGDSILLRGSTVGLIGFGNLGRSLHRLLTAFHPVIRAYDPWIPDAVLRDLAIIPAGLTETLASSRFIFVLAAVTDTNEHLLGRTELLQVQPGARLILVSRAAVVDFDALIERVRSGAFLAAVDVWPQEPLPAAHPARSLEGMLLSPHRAGGIPQAFHSIGEMVCDDLELMARGLPPARLQIAAPELVGRYRNKPVE
ncbi:MAG TPA: NAD(P)-dependent oxidoreductase [Kineosporiaceae bacterium]|nr:NAD(P)-dependent oxidoreductase [Kineosporiaceae bacterium]